MPALGSPNPLPAESFFSHLHSAMNQSRRRCSTPPPGRRSCTRAGTLSSSAISWMRTRLAQPPAPRRRPASHAAGAEPAPRRARSWWTSWKTPCCPAAASSTTTAATFSLSGAPRCPGPAPLRRASSRGRRPAAFREMRLARRRPPRAQVVQPGAGAANRQRGALRPPPQAAGARPRPTPPGLRAARGEGRPCAEARSRGGPPP